MAVTAAVAADLALLARGVEPDCDLADMLAVLAADVRAAVRSYVGLTLSVAAADPSSRLRLVDTVADPAAVRTSLMMPVPSAGRGLPGRDGATLVLYAGAAGAFVDLAADLSWLTGLALDTFELDRHLAAFAEPGTGATMRSLSVIDQAIGVLIGRGHTREQAVADLDVRAAATAGTRYDAAASILDHLVRVEPDPMAPE